MASLTRMEGIETVRVPKTSEVVARRIRGQIVSGELAEGSFLPAENELLQRYGVSRPIMREAFRILESERLISLRRGARSGAQVLAPSCEVAARFAGFVLQAQQVTLADVFSARLLLFPPAARMLAEAHTAADLVMLRRARAAVEAAADDPGRFVRLAADFNLQVVELTRSPTLLLLAGMLDEIIDQADTSVVDEWRARPSVRREQAANVVASMDRLIGFVNAGDGPGAEAFWREEMNTSRRYTLKLLGPKTVLDLME